MKDSLRKGISFGLTSAVITTLGRMVGLHSGTHSKIVVLAGILTIAIADAFSYALGIHISEEAENTHTVKQIWEASIARFLTNNRLCRINLFFLLVEPVFANIKTHKGMYRFTLRERIKVNIQWLLYCMVHNVGKIVVYGVT